MTAEIRIPYVLTGQSRFRSNGFEKAPWKVWFSEQPQGEGQTVYFLSNDEYVRQELRAEFVEGLNDWLTIYEKIGFFPTYYDGPGWKEIYKIGAGGRSRGWDDLGGYAYFISAVAAYEIEFGEGPKFKLK